MVLRELCWEPEIPETGKCSRMISPGPTAKECKTLTKTESDSHTLLLPLPPRCSHLAMKTTGQEVWKDQKLERQRKAPWVHRPSAHPNSFLSLGLPLVRDQLEELGHVLSPRQSLRQREPRQETHEYIH